MLERLFLDGPETPHEAKALSTETLLDILLILYNECCNSSLRKEKTLTDFIELGRKPKNVYLSPNLHILTDFRCIELWLFNIQTSENPGAFVALKKRQQQ